MLTKILIGINGRANVGSVNSNGKITFHLLDSGKQVCECSTIDFITIIPILLTEKQITKIIETDNLGLFNVDTEKLKSFAEICEKRNSI